LHVHLADPDFALNLLRRSTATRHDPWLIAAEIATSMVAARTPRFIKEGRRLLGSGTFDAFHTAELAAALGSVEYESGSARTGKKLFLQALRDPTENTLAQAKWISRRERIDLVESRLLDIPGSFEARAWQAYMTADWEGALREARKWLLDEPFSSRPAMFGSYVAAVVLDDHDSALRFAQMGLAANPRDAVLLNNVAFSLACQGKPSSAQHYLERALEADADGETRVVLLATAGLIGYRSGRFAEGRALYEDAIELAQSLKNRVQVALGLALLAREEILSHRPGAAAVLAAAGIAARNISGHGVSEVLVRISALLRGQR
jgi:tetratricopeptide (TPR) repeat protein